MTSSQSVAPYAHEVWSKKIEYLDPELKEIALAYPKGYDATDPEKSHFH